VSRLTKTLAALVAAGALGALGACDVINTGLGEEESRLVDTLAGSWARVDPDDGTVNWAACDPGFRPILTSRGFPAVRTLAISTSRPTMTGIGGRAAPPLRR